MMITLTITPRHYAFTPLIEFIIFAAFLSRFSRFQTD
jgi:hypothetical protein